MMKVLGVHLWMDRYKYMIVDRRNTSTLHNVLYLSWNISSVTSAILLGVFRSIVLSNTELNNTELESFQIINGRRLFEYTR